MSIRIAAETPLQDEVRGFVASLNDYLQPLSPPEFQFQLTAEQMAGPDVTVFVARDEAGAAVGMASVKVLDARTGEVKRMFVPDALRGRRIGERLLEELEGHARALGLSILKLETGSTAGFEPAWRLYERAGFTRCGAFGDYPDSPYNAFYEKRL